MKIELSEDKIARLLDLVGDRDDEIAQVCESALDLLEAAKDLCEENEFEPSENQLAFVVDALAADLEINFRYSGRGMMGRKCPAVNLDRGERMKTSADVSIDAMGRGTVVYVEE
jgi:hypothetical protein